MYQENLFTRNLSLFETLCEIETLRDGFRAVKKNKGAPGVDGKTIEDFEANLEEELAQLKDDLENWRYEPQPVRRVEILKSDGKSTRKLGIPNIRDRVCQSAMKQILEPLIDPKFSNSSYGFRPNRGQQHAIKAALQHAKEGKEFTVDIDLEQFFDRVNQDRLIWRLGTYIDDKRILRIVGDMLRGGVMIDGIYCSTPEGTTQGSPLSPLLSNVVLDELDKELERRNLAFCRFADDSNVFVKSQKAAERVLASLTKFIEVRMKLKINRAKSKAAPTSEVKFLGMTIVKGTAAISKKSVDKAMEKVKELTRRGSHLPLDKTIEKINRWFNGWASYYRMTQYPSQLHKIEAHVRRRLRSRLIGENKRRRFLARKLIKMGSPAGLVYKTVFSNKGRWALSHTPATEKAWTNKWFVDQGLSIWSDRELEGWFGVKQWIKLT